MWVGVQSPRCGSESRRHMAEAGESDELVAELADESHKPYGYVDNDSEDDAGLFDAPGAAVLTARPPDPSKKNTRRQKKKVEHSKAKLTSAAESKKEKVELRSAAKKQSFSQAKSSEWHTDADSWQYPPNWYSNQQTQKHWTSTQRSNRQPQQQKRFSTSPHPFSSAPKIRHMPPPPMSLHAQPAAATPQPIFSPAASSNNPFSSTVSAQPTIPTNLPPGTVVCILPSNLLRSSFIHFWR